jgi:hypothetical protein
VSGRMACEIERGMSVEGRRKGNMSRSNLSERDRAMAKRCVECPVCNHARKRQRGLAFWFVKRIEGGLCPYCKAYERVYGRRAHERLPAGQSS